jgi:hypothetical protein
VRSRSEWRRRRSSFYRGVIPWSFRLRRKTPHRRRDRQCRRRRRSPRPSLMDPQ